MITDDLSTACFPRPFDIAAPGPQADRANRRSRGSSIISNPGEWSWAVVTGLANGGNARVWPIEASKLGHDLVDRRDGIAGRAARRQIEHMVEARPW
jgi:hypothetical protein